MLDFVFFSFSPPTCPRCGLEPQGTVETLTGVALFQPNPEGAPPGYHYHGETVIDWHSQSTVTTPKGRVMLQCGQCGEQWPALATRFPAPEP